ncbi:MAG: hypothetical protein LBL79_00545 [Prevotella sp.]|nr:hypothetical protein [Prevotella sp.]
MSGDDIKEPPTADAITGCLRTTKNTLSVWRINNEAELEEAVLAIAAGQDRLETIDVVMLDDDYFVKCDIVIEETEGLTPVVDLKNTHVDLCSLDFWSIGMVAEHIVESIKKDKHRRFREAELTKIIKNAIATKRLELADLKDGI